MTAKKAATSAKHKTATKKHAASAKHTETKAQLAHLHVLHVEHTEHLAHLAATGKSVTVKATPAKPAKATKKVAFAVGDLLPVCAFEAVAQSLRLAGQPVHDDDVGELWHLLGEPAEGVPVGEALAAAALFGLAGYRPAWLQVPVEPVGRLGEGKHCGRRAESGPAPWIRCPEVEAVGHDEQDGQEYRESQPRAGGYPPNGLAHGLILGIDRPGPHAVLATADGWWSWGELYDPWACTVGEAWAVSWS